MTFVDACCSYNWEAVPVRSQEGSLGKPTDLGWVASDILLWRSEPSPIPCTPFFASFSLFALFHSRFRKWVSPRGPAAVAAVAATHSNPTRLTHATCNDRMRLKLRAAEVDPIFKKKNQLKLAVTKNRYGHNFQNIASKTNQRGLIVSEPTLIQFGADILKIVAVSVFCNGS